MTPRLIIRPFEPRDAPRLDAIRAEAFAPVFASFRALLGDEIARIALVDAEQEQKALLAGLCAGHADTHVFVAARGADPIGFVCTRLERVKGLGEIILDAVSPSETRKGVGTALIEHALCFMRSRGMRAAVVGVGGQRSRPLRRFLCVETLPGPTLPCGGFSR